MSFDIDILLVPAFLVFFCVWLFDITFRRNVRPSEQRHRQEARLVHTLSKHLKRKKYPPLSDKKSQEYLSKVAPPKQRSRYNRLLWLRARPRTMSPYLVAQAHEWLPVLAGLIFLRTFLFQPFNIPSSSMVPTLYTGDFILVNKFSYGLRLPLIHAKILDTGSPQGGDVAVFRYPQNPSLHYIKRVIGVGGDVVRYDAITDTLLINEVPTTQGHVDFTLNQDALQYLLPGALDGRPLSADERIGLGVQEEALARYQAQSQGTTHYITRQLDGVYAGRFAPFLSEVSPLWQETDGLSWQVEVPHGHYFVMGDNRDRSEDGRFWGFVPDSHLSGKAVVRFMHKAPGLHLPTFASAGKVE